MKCSELKVGNRIIIDNEEYTVEGLEISKIGKHGHQKCRIEARAKNGELRVFVRASDFEVEVL